MELQKDEILERLAIQGDKQRAEGDAAVEAFIAATVEFRQGFLLEAVRSYLKTEANKAFGYLDEGRRLVLKDEVLRFIQEDPRRVRTWLESVSWPQRKRTARDTEREFNKPCGDYAQLETTVRGLTDGLALILRRHGLGLPKDQETVRRLYEAVPQSEKWSEPMNRAWNLIEKVKKQVTETERERDERLALLEREKIAREIDELFLGVADDPATEEFAGAVAA